VGFGPPICRGGHTPDLEHTLSNRTHFRACGQFWLSSVQRAWRVAGEKKKTKVEEEHKEDRIPVKRKTANNYVGRPNDDSFQTQCRRIELARHNAPNGQTLINTLPSHFDQSSHRL